MSVNGKNRVGSRARGEKRTGSSSSMRGRKGWKQGDQEGRKMWEAAAA